MKTTIITSLFFLVSLCSFSQDPANHMPPGIAARYVDLDGFYTKRANDLEKRKRKNNTSKSTTIANVKEETFESYNLYKNLAIENYKNEKYLECIIIYNSSSKLGHHDAYFEYITAISCYRVSKKEANSEYYRKAKKLLKLAKKHGSSEAASFLNKNF